MRRKTIWIGVCLLVMSGTRSGAAELGFEPPRVSSTTLKALEVSTAPAHWKPLPTNPVPQLTAWQRVLVRSIRFAVMVMGGILMWDIPPKKDTPP